MDDYRIYERKTTVNRSLQRAKFHLNKWGRIERNFAKLTPEWKRIAKRLFATLKKMTPEERAFLANKYRVDITTSYGRNDIELAREYDMSRYEYSELRKGIEYKFYHYLEKIRDE